MKQKEQVNTPEKNDLLERKHKEKEHLNEDHRAIGQQLDLFSINEEVGIGLVLWHPKGTIIRRIIRDFWEEEHLRNGYQLVHSPHIARGELWKTSGHLNFFKQNMYIFKKNRELHAVKPMNCPLHIQIYKSRPRSYRDLPVRYAECGTVYRYERSGTLQGLLRVRGFTQDDAHIFCTPEQVDEEIARTLDFARDVLKKFGFCRYNVYLSTRGLGETKKYMGLDEDWKSAEKALAHALERKGITYCEMIGEAVFYGPKIDIKVVDSSGREWQCSTIQFDFNLPKRFNVTFVGSDGKEHEVVMIHRALLGAIERFFAILIEHYKGNLPVWLAPTQVKILPISDRYTSHAVKVNKRLQVHGIRSNVDNSSSTIDYKIREAEAQKIPYMLICGKHEVKLKKVSVRKHGAGDVGLLTIEQFIKNIKSECHG